MIKKNTFLARTFFIEKKFHYFFFYQGMEDCVVLNEIMDKYEDDLTKVLPAYSEHRNPDAEAIVDLAMYNYIEVGRSLRACFIATIFKY